jgi:hypothetical protein
VFGSSRTLGPVVFADLEDAAGKVIGIDPDHALATLHLTFSFSDCNPATVSWTLAPTGLPAPTTGSAQGSSVSTSPVTTCNFFQGLFDGVSVTRTYSVTARDANGRVLSGGLATFDVAPTGPECLTAVSPTR